MMLPLLLCGCGRINYDPLPTCDPGWLGNGVVAAYAMGLDGTSLIDTFVAHPGVAEQSPQVVPGVCGSALSFSTGERLVIPDAPEWDLDSGSFDLWILPLGGAPTRMQGILSRDATGRDFPGHIAFIRASSGQVGVRIQGQASVAVVCSDDAVLTDRWTHVGVNWGPPTVELFVDGVAQDGTGILEVSDIAQRTCGVHSAASITGNDNPWILGVNGTATSPGSSDPTDFPFHGHLDEFRISSERRDFSSVTIGSR